MQKEASKALIGVFVVGAVALAVTGAVLFGSGSYFSKLETFVLYFDGSVDGLNVGAPVKFRGVRIGSVKDIKVIFNSENLSLSIPVFIDIDLNSISRLDNGSNYKPDITSVMIQKGLKARLVMQSLVTGRLEINLDFFPDKPVKLAKKTAHPEIPTIRSSFQEFSRALEKMPIEKILNKMLSAIEGIEKVVHSPEAMGSMREFHQAVIDIRKFVMTADTNLKKTATLLNTTLADTQKLVVSIDREIKPLKSDVERTLKTTRTAAYKAEKAFENIRKTTSKDSELHRKFDEALDEFTLAARSMRFFADYIERHPEALIYGKKGL